jgi:large subunit ribosomal protein L7/L12
MSTIQKIHYIIDILKTLTLFEAAELVKSIENTFNVKATYTTQEIKKSSDEIISPIIEEKTEFDLALDVVPSEKRIEAIKLVRKLTNIGIKEAKDLVNACPTNLKQILTKEKAEDFKNQFSEIGLLVKII